MDEIKDVDQLDNFFKFRESIKSPMNTDLDIFAAFIDSN